MKGTGAMFLGLLALATVQPATASPVERVVKLLEDLKTKLVLDEKTEQQIYDKYACWCEKTTERKGNAIVDGTNELRMVGQTILKLKGLIATRAAEIDELAADIKENLKEQEEATNVRQKENTEWQEESAETKEALAAMQQAITVLVNATTEKSSAALLQSQTQATSAVQKAVNAMPTRVQLKPDQVSMLSEFLGSAGSAKYMPQSFTVQGILKDMYDTFSTDLEKATLTEANQNRDFEKLIATKTAELNDMQKEKKQKEEEKAEAELMLADAQQIYDDTTEQKKADITFFDETKEACEAKHEAWTIRSDLRTEEIAGVEKALEILTSDDARELFASSIKAGKETGASDSYKTGRDIAPSFLQLRGSADSSAPAMKAWMALKASATKTRSLRIAALAVAVRSAKVGHFDGVVKAIDDMIKTLNDEEASDIAKRDQCKDEYLKIESTIKNVTWLIEKNTAKIDKLTSIIEKRNKQLAKTVEDIADVTKQMKDMTDERETENAEFKQAKSEDQQAIDLLMEAREALTAYYKKNDIDMGPIQGSVKGVFTQQPDFEVSEDQAPDATFSGKGKRKDESKGIVQIMTMIIEDLDDEIKNGMKAEEQAQLEYEGLMKAASDLKKQLEDKKTALEKAISERESERSDEELDKQNNEADLKDEEDYKAQIKPDCDWIMGAFYKRAEAREAEMNGLVEAKEYLAGMKPAAMLQGSKPFDDLALSKISFAKVQGLRR